MCECAHSCVQQLSSLRLLPPLCVSVSFFPLAHALAFPLFSPCRLQFVLSLPSRSLTDAVAIAAFPSSSTAVHRLTPPSVAAPLPLFAMADGDPLSRWEQEVWAKPLLMYPGSFYQYGFARESGTVAALLWTCAMGALAAPPRDLAAPAAAPAAAPTPSAPPPAGAGAALVVLQLLLHLRLLLLLLLLM